MSGSVDDLEPEGAYGFKRPSVGIFQGAIAFCQSGFDLEVDQEVVRENDELLPGTRAYRSSVYFETRGGSTVRFAPGPELMPGAALSFLTEGVDVRRFEPDVLRGVGYTLFCAAGYREEDARTVVNHLVDSNLFGHYSHGQ